MKKIKHIMLFIAILTLCSGCLFKTGDELLQAPRASTDYIALQNELDKEISNGSVYASAEFGSNRATIQLIDIDADSEEEVVAFFRESALAGTFNIVVYKKIGSEYKEVGRMKGYGNSIDEVAYPKLSPFGAGGIAVSWRISNQTEKGLTIAKFENGSLEVVLDTQYSSYFLYDIDYDGVEEVFIINQENSRHYVRMYKMINGEMILVSTVELSKEIDTIARTTMGELLSGGRAIALDSRIEGETGLITDLLTLSYDGNLINLTIDPETKSGMGNYRLISTYTANLNTINNLYVPTLTPMILSKADTSNTLNWITTWHMYDVHNDMKSDIYTYHNSAEGWYYELTKDVISNITTNRTTASNTKITQFRYATSAYDTIALFEIYTVPNDDYSESSFGEEYIKLGKTTTNVYLGKNLNPQSIVRVTDQEIIDNFNVISGN